MEDGQTQKVCLILEQGMASSASSCSHAIDSKIRNAPQSIEYVGHKEGDRFHVSPQQNVGRRRGTFPLEFISDATALGCAFLTGLQTGFWKGTVEVCNLIRSDETYSPRISPTQRQMLLDGWHDFLKAKGIFT